MAQDISNQLKSEIFEILTSLYPETNLGIEKVTLERPKNSEHGDYATAIALVLSKLVRQKPNDIANSIAEKLKTSKLVSKVEIAGPGFINILLNQNSQGSILQSIILAGNRYGQNSLLVGENINLEFVSANPTGPLHLGHTRWAALGDALGRIMRNAGAAVTQEFYVNDRGVQMDMFGKSLQAAALNEPRPEEGYHGEYIADLAAAVVAENPEILKLDKDAQAIAFRDLGYKLQLQEQKDVLEEFHTHFDVWFSEKSLYESGEFEKALERLKAGGHVYEEGGATWLRTTDFGDDKDRVIMKSDGALAYFASDCAYYDSKRMRGFTINIYLLGADHHGYIGRLKAIAAARGDDPNKNIEVLIGQLVKIMENGEEVKLSKRAGTVITLKELVEKVGVDAARYTLIRYPSETPMVMDVDLLRKHSNDNPVYYVQYAHARIAQLLKNASELGVKYGLDNFDPSLLTHERERNLIGALAEFPSVTLEAAKFREPHRISRYTEELAATYHRFYADCRVLPMGDEQPTALHSARLILCQATKQTIANALELLGVSAPEKM
jgi:arginyl-tRNA synthetase